MNIRPPAPPALPSTAAPAGPEPESPEPESPEPESPEPASAAEQTTGRYARIFALAGPGFLPVAFLARLPLAMLTVGALTLVTSVTGSYATGGLAAGAVGIGSAIGAPVLGFVADRIGQRPVLLAAAGVNPLATALVLYMAFLLPGAASPLGILAAAFVMGATCPQVGPLARVRWMAMTSRRPAAGTSAGPGARDLDTAMSYEGTADELSFVLGPALVGLLAAAVAPWLPLAIAAVLTLSMVTAFAVHPTVRSVVPARTARALAKTAPAGSGSGSAGPAPEPRADRLLIALPVLGMVAMGTFFGGTQTSLTAFGGLFDISSAAGLLYAVMGISSAVAALSVAYWPERFGPAARWMAAAAAMTVFSVLLLLPADIPTMLVALFVLGIPVGPTMVSIFGMGAVVAPRHLMGTVMTLLASGVVTGTALGSALAGGLADSHGHQAAFLVTVGAAAALLLLSLCTQWAVSVRRGAGANAAG